MALLTDRAPHPGETLRDDILPELGLSVTQAAGQLGGPKHGPSAESWLRQQLQYDLWHARQTPEPDVQPAIFGR